MPSFSRDEADQPHGWPPSTVGMKDLCAVVKPVAKDGWAFLQGSYFHASRTV